MTLSSCILITIPVCISAILMQTYFDSRKYKRIPHLIVLLSFLFPTLSHAQYIDNENCRISFKSYENHQGKLEYNKEGIIYQFFILYKEIYIVQSVHQAVFLVGIDFKMLALARGLVGNGLFGQVHFHFRFGIGENRVEKFFQERFAHHHGKHEIIQFVVLMDIRKEAAHHHAETIVLSKPARSW